MWYIQKKDFDKRLPIDICDKGLGPSTGPYNFVPFSCTEVGA